MNLFKRTLPSLSGAFIIVVATFFLPEVTSAHTTVGAVGGFLSGFLHPLSGLDHLVAMVAVGIWGAYLGRPAIYLLPITFPLVMAVGGSFGVVFGTEIPLVETGIALSAIILGFVIIMEVRPKLQIAALIVGIFALCHGYAHGVELPSAASPVTYAIGFVLATGLLHLSGIALGETLRWSVGRVALRIVGGIIMLIGVGFLFGLL